MMLARAWNPAIKRWKMLAIILKVTHFNHAGILSILGVGILDFPIPENIFHIFLGRFLFRRNAQRLGGANCATFYPNRVPQEAHRRSLIPAQAAIKARTSSWLSTIVASTFAAILITGACAQAAIAQVSYSPGAFADFKKKRILQVKGSTVTIKDKLWITETHPKLIVPRLPPSWNLSFKISLI
jgi:hypothetical protein